MNCRYPGYIGHCLIDGPVPGVKCLRWDFDLHYIDDYLIEFNKFEVMVHNDAVSGTSLIREVFTNAWWSDDTDEV